MVPSVDPTVEVSWILTNLCWLIFLRCEKDTDVTLRSWLTCGNLMCGSARATSPMKTGQNRRRDRVRPLCPPSQRTTLVGRESPSSRRDITEAEAADAGHASCPDPSSCSSRRVKRARWKREGRHRSRTSRGRRPREARVYAEHICDKRGGAHEAHEATHVKRRVTAKSPTEKRTITLEQHSVMRRLMGKKDTQIRCTCVERGCG